MKKEINHKRFIADIVEALFEVAEYEDIYTALLDLYEDKQDLSWLLYDLIGDGYGIEELEILGFDQEDVEYMANRSMHGMGPE